MGSAFTPKMGGVQTAAKASSMSGPTMAAVPCGINGFGRIGRLVARIMIKDPETNVRFFLKRMCFLSMFCMLCDCFFVQDAVQSML